MLIDYFPLLMQIILASGFAVIALGMSVLLGKKGRSCKQKDSAYECGMLPVGEGTSRFSIQFYLVAMLFVLFDIEVVFMYPWALQFRDLISEHSTALVSMAGFAGILGVAYIYALLKGAFYWNK